MVVAIAAILGTIAVPSFQAVIKNNRIVTETNDFVGDINYARMEAIKRNTNVNLCKSSNGTTCDSSGANWAIGWMVYWDSNNSQALDTGEDIMRKRAALGGTASLNVAATSPLVNQIVFTKTGLVANNSTKASFYLCDDRGVSQGREIDIEVTGRPTILRDNIATCTP